MHNFVKFSYGLLFILVCSNIGAASENKTVTAATVNDNVLKPPVSVAVEGGNLPLDETHLGREHVVDKPDLLPKALNNTANKTVDILEGKPVNENLQGIELGVSKKNDNTKVVAKKGAPVENSTSAVTNTSIKTNVTASSVQPKILSDIRPKKPMITVHGDESLAAVDGKYNKSDLRFLEKKSNRADYVIPIVAVILSVPLVAIIISVLYKRGTYWWQHRNYRRMDFLIEGMYNN